MLKGYKVRLVTVQAKSHLSVGKNRMRIPVSEASVATPTQIL